MVVSARDAPPPPLSPAAVVVREVWQHNLEEEFDLIKIALMTHTIVSMDTEFPGVIYKPVNVEKRDLGRLPPFWNYQLMRHNVNATNIIQLGLGLCDHRGCLPNLGTDSQYVWQFSFKDFDVHNDLQNPESIELLERQGIDFEKNLEEGIDSADFAALMVESGLVMNGSDFTWVTFHGGYDFAHLIKIVTGQELPCNLVEFMDLVQLNFGRSVFDVKHMIRFCDGLYGGLERVANTLGVHRVAGRSHQAGSDTLLTLQTFMKFMDVYFKEKKDRATRHNGHLLRKVSFVLHGLEWIDFDPSNEGLKLNPLGDE
ncbi:probable CCR4-associated factor 1 homolog 11 [Quercus suber]|uniref:probable CCR4-associated factor 1 homolog 11 n=1 Tax=Quercus suber TaxID=58331 RepID=UPI0032DFDA5C